MPECDGWSVLRKLKADPQLAQIPVIMVTVVDNEAMGFDLGASNYLIKPVDRDRLAVLIERHRVARSSASTASKPSRPAADKEETLQVQLESPRRS